jgi:23S rRNA pseudouridine955/2504/2580 synthase
VLNKSEIRYLNIASDHNGRRIDNYLQWVMKGLPASRLYRMLRRGEVRVNGGRVGPGYRLQEGDRLRLPPYRLEESAPIGQISPSLRKILVDSVIFEDDGLLVMNKPAGLAVHGGSSLTVGLIEALRAIRPEAEYLELAHRLDRGTSGCLLVAKNPPTLRYLHQALREDRVEKCYLALVMGTWRVKHKAIHSGLSKHRTAAGERQVRIDEAGKESATVFTAIEHFKDATLVEARPITGRTHQIRVHAQAAGHPIAGDPKYGDFDYNRQLKRSGLNRLFLHAASVRLPGRGPGGHLSIKAPLPRELEQVLGTLRNA